MLIHRIPAKTVRILLVEDAGSVRRALRHVLGSEPDFEVIGETGDGEHAVALAAALKPTCSNSTSGAPAATRCPAET